jgi:hypothetical protein
LIDREKKFLDIILGFTQLRETNIYISIPRSKIPAGILLAKFAGSGRTSLAWVNYQF